MINETGNADIAGIRAMTDEEIEATSGAGILSDIWNGIVGAVHAVIDFVKDAFGGAPAPWRGPFAGPQGPGNPPWPPRPL